MQSTVQERSLADQLRRRVAAEKEFARAGGKIQTKSFFRRHEKRYIAPVLKAGLQTLGLYERGRQEALNPVVAALDLDFPDLPGAFDGSRILQLSDLHIDGFDGITDAVARVLESIAFDLCVLTGDYRYDDEGPCDEVYRQIRKLLPGLAARHGIYAILGNHDESEMAFALEDMGIRVLVNEAVEIELGNQSIWLAGIDDPFDYKCDDLPRATAGVPSDSFKILLAHTPELYKEAAELGIHLYLCGHTHGGQLRLPKIGALRSNAKCPRAYTYRYWNYQGMHGYTSGGIGSSSVPVRLNCPPELVLITLHKPP